MVIAKKSSASCPWSSPSKRKSCSESALRAAWANAEFLILQPTGLSMIRMLEIKNLHAGVDGREILKGLNLTINSGEVHAIMGPNGSGKSTLAAVLAGRGGYDVSEGQVLYQGKDLLEMDP